MPEAVDLFRKSTNVSRETINKLIKYQNLIEKWQKRVNLIGPDTVNDIWKRHFQDSIQLLDLIPDKSKTIVDFGSGAGFPGMVLAIAGAPHVHLIESDAKKISFLKEVARITETDVKIHHNRIEENPLQSADFLVSRACSALKDLLELSLPYISRETTCLFHKGKSYSKEIIDAEKFWVFKYQIIPSVTDIQGVILKITNIKRRYDKGDTKS